MNRVKSLIVIFVLLSVSRVHCSDHSAWDCFDGPSKLMVFDDATIDPAPIIYPGNVTINGLIDITQDVPSEGLSVRTEIYKLTPRKMKIPCMKGRGSCDYDVCSDILPNHQDQFCAFGLCSCPVNKGKYSGKGITYELPDIGGPVFKKILSGDYTGRITFYNQATKATYGAMCMNFTISLVEKP